MSILDSNHYATNTYYDPMHQIDAVKLLPGEYYATQKEMMLVTVLGSCVAACIWDNLLQIGGMNHFMLPGDENSGTSARYGDYAMSLLIDQLLRMGARKENFKAKVFGGGNVLPGFSVTSIGERNAAFTLDYLHHVGIPVVAHDLTDIFPRKIYFFPKTGRALVKKLHVKNNTIFERERSHLSQIKQELTLISQR